MIPQKSPAFDEKAFHEPSAEFRSFPLWTWNVDIDEELIDRMLEGFRKAGMGGAFVHPRPGLITEYLSEEWFRLWGYALEKAKSLGLSLQVYDENSYPSCFAGGHVCEALPDAVARYLYPRAEAKPGARESTGPSDVYDFLFPDGEKGESRPETLAAFLGRDGRKVEVELRSCKPTGWLAGFAFPDCSDPRVVKKFLEVTHERYARHFREELGRTIRYFFFDEPELLSTADGIPFSDSIARWFREHRGYDFVERLPDFFSDGPGSREVRYDYLLTLHEVWLEHFIKPVCAWGGANGVNITGHVMEHQWPYQYNGSSMAVYRWMQMPGIDLLGFQYHAGDRAGNGLFLLTVRELASVANQLGKPRTLCEIHGGGGTDYGPENLKSLVDWALVHGVNFLNEHFCTASMVGSRKYDFPQFFNDFSPWFREYRPLADHQARLCYALSRGRQVNRVLVLQPTTSAWPDHPLKIHGGSEAGDRRQLERLAATQTETVQRLADQAIDFDLGDEFILAEFGRVTGDGFTVGERSYDVVVLPPGTRNLLLSTLDLLTAWLEKGGKVLSCAGGGLIWIDGREDREALKKLAAFPGWEEISGLAWSETLGHRLAELAPPKVTLPGRSKLPDQVYHHCRELEDGGRLHLFVNSGTEKAVFDARIEGGHVRRLDTFDGSLHPHPAIADGKGLRVRVELERTGHLLLLSGPEVRATGEAPAASAGGSGRFFEFASFENVRRVEPNALTLDFCDLRTDGDWRRDRYVRAASHELWKAHGRPSPPWSWAVQFRRNLIDTRFGENTGFDCEYHFDTGDLGEEALRGIDLAVEWPRLYRITVNGAELSFDGAETWMDCRIGRVRAGHLLRPGPNTVRLSCRPLHILAEIGPAWLLGDFSLQAADKGFRLAAARPLETGAWFSQGMPFYHETVAYEASFETAEPSTRFRIRLGNLRASSFGKAWIDDHPLGVAQFPPHELSGTRKLAAGRHRLRVEVAGNWKNLIGPHFGEVPVPVPDAWEKFSVPRPSGDQYRFDSYGLLEPVRLELW